MAKNLYDLRFGIRRDDGYISSLWRLWVTRKNDVYLTTKGMGGVEKCSFHASGICRSAFTKEHGAPSSLKDRAVFKWKRSTTPPKDSGQVSRVAWIAFPTDYLSRFENVSEKKITWIDSAFAGGATYVELCYTLDSEKAILPLIKGTDRRLLSYTHLLNGEGLLVTYYHADWENKDLRIPAGTESIFPDLLFSTQDPRNTGRPIRIRFGSAPKDGDALRLQELGGYEEINSELA